MVTALGRAVAQATDAGGNSSLHAAPEAALFDSDQPPSWPSSVCAASKSAAGSRPARSGA